MKVKECTIGDLGKIITGKTPSTKNKELWDGEVPFITPKDIQGSKHIFATERCISEKGKDCVKGIVLPKGAICVSCIGNIGYVGMTTQKSITNQQINSIVPNEDTDKDFVYYLMKNLWLFFKNYEGQSTTLSILNKTQFSKIAVCVPPLATQKKIARVLGALDDKIELNNQINHNLEEQAKALFKSWFVDFEPFGGKIPEDWTVYKIGDFLPVITGKKNANISSAKGQYPFFSCSQEIAWTDDYSFEGDAILVAGNGDFNVKFYKGKFEAYQRTYVLIPSTPRYASWLYYVVKYNLNLITQSARGSVIKFITKGNLEDFEFAAPKNLADCEIIDVFSSINNTIFKNRQENYRLAELRDALLPKLMSGEIDVGDVKIDRAY